MIRHRLGFVKPKKGAPVQSNNEVESNTAALIDKDESSSDDESSDDGSSDEEISDNSDDSEDEDNDPVIEASPLKPIRSHGRGSETGVFDASFCSFVHSIQGESSEKVSYLVAQKRVVTEGAELAWERQDKEQNTFHDAQLTELLRQTQSRGSFDPQLYSQVQTLARQYLDSDEDDLGLELVRGEARKSFGRIVRAPLKKKGHIYIDYCAAPGRIVRARVTKASSKAAPGIYSAARKSRWGGVWPDALCDHKGGAPYHDESGQEHHEVIVATTPHDEV
jgi:hypothetical protein